MRDRVKKVIILGSSALKIGEAGEFDYSGSQAIKALREEGVQTVLINPNIATIQTDDYLADNVYFLPITPDFVERVIEKEKPDGILISFGGQTALNCGIALHKSGVLKRHNVRILGTPIETVIDTEDRERFVARLNEVKADAPRSKAATNVPDALAFAKELGYPVMLRIAFALGGLGSGVCRTEDELRTKCEKAFSYAPQVLVEEYLHGWKEVEYEVVRDRFDNCLTVCNMENFDPLGIHTGESIVVAPSQTLSNRDYHHLREVSIRVIRHLGIVGECNIQFALDPHSDNYRIIEVNARLSRSSALASKATGYPLAFVAAKLILGYGLHELPNSITKVTKAFFEPALDYIVVKMPRWDLRKFRRVSRRIGSSMKSVGEVMAIGRTFEEAIQKALRMLDVGVKGLVGNGERLFDDIERELSEPTEQRLFAVVEAIRQGMPIDKIHDLSRIDRWFLEKIASVVELESRLSREKGACLQPALLREAKRSGFSDPQIAAITGTTPETIRAGRIKHGIRPAIRQIDTLAAEYPAQTNYLYLTYHGTEDDIDTRASSPLPLPLGEGRGEGSRPLHGSSLSSSSSSSSRSSAVGGGIMILGSGAYRIGCSVEFDWCCVNAAHTLRKLGKRTVMLNYNPETVSTDYDESDLLFFDEINAENVIELYERLGLDGVIVSMGGQIPNNLALTLERAGVKVMGTTPASIDAAENRHTFSKLLDELDIDQPEWKELSTLDQARAFANSAGYPVLVRPSYVLSGAAMAVALNDDELTGYLQKATELSPEHPIVMSKFLENAKEIEFDAVARDGEIMVYAISEHVENAGVHSGDATLVFPPQRTYLETIRQIRKIGRRIAGKLHINGPFNIQFIARDNEVKVIECNLRASRSFPFVSKILKQNFIDIATKVIAGAPVEKPDKTVFELNHVGVKAPQFSFTRLDGADPILGVEMASTGEVGCIGDDFSEAFLKAYLSVGFRLPVKSILISAGSIESKAELLPAARALHRNGINFYATGGTAKFLGENGIASTHVAWPSEMNSGEEGKGGAGSLSAIDCIKQGKVDLVINIPRSDQRQELTNGYIVRRAAVDHNVPLITNRQIAQRLADSLARVKDSRELQVKAWAEY
ncbi:MAG TPA: carbamoyl-phosphate synthase large subunit [Phycisphaerales bacterium]|nr:carbamoyl-phosphate synthase large subunit [Phycisphaerales bacterium]